MVAYAETFLANRKVYGLEKLEDGTVSLWASGCRIGVEASMYFARVSLHRYIDSQLRADIGSAESQLLAAKTALDKIEGDAFYLAKLLIPNR